MNDRISLNTDCKITFYTVFILFFLSLWQNLLDINKNRSYLLIFWQNV